MKTIINSMRRHNAAKILTDCRTGSGLIRQIKRRVRHAFTLIELLVVIALTAILLSVILYPLVNSYALTARASTQIESQAAARSALSQVKTILSNSAYIFDNYGRPNPGSGSADTSLNLWVNDNQGNPALITSRNNMIEYVAAAKQLDQVAVASGKVAVDPTTGQPIYDDSLTPEQTGIALPITPGRSLGRIFIGLIDNESIADTHVQDLTFNPYDNKAGADRNGMPKKIYANKFDDLRTVNNSNDNRYTLWNAEVPTFILDPIVKNAGVRQFVPNLGLFHIKDKNGNIDDNINEWLDPDVHRTKGLRLILHDPNFFYDNSFAGGDGDIRWKVGGWKDLNGDGKVQIWENWRAASTNLLLGSNSKIDLLAVDRDQNSNAINYYDSKGVLVTAAAVKGLPHVRPLARFAPGFVQNDPGTPSFLDASGNEVPNSVPALYNAQYTHWANPYRVLVYRAPAGNPIDQQLYNYYESVDDGRIVHVQNLMHGDKQPDPYGLPDVGPKLSGANSIFGNPNAEFAYTVDAERGTVNFAFPSTVLIHDATGNGLTQVYDPVKVNQSTQNVIVGDTRRWVDLRADLDPAANPVQWNTTVTPLSVNSNWAADVRITPGSELVFGPDQIPGTHYGYRTQYTRVPALTSVVGPNHYKINYQDISNLKNPADPSQRVGFLEFRGGADQGADNPIQGLYKSNGLPELKVFAGANAPSDPVEAAYKFQMNRPNDVVKIDYLTRELIGLTIEARLYDPGSAKPQTTILNENIKVRNLQR